MVLSERIVPGAGRPVVTAALERTERQQGHRAEEQRFLEDMPAVLGSRAMLALEQIATALDLDYAGMDFALGPDGTVLLFEANATMLINPPAPDAIWNYRREPAARALAAAQQLLAQAAR